MALLLAAILIFSIIVLLAIFLIAEFYEMKYGNPFDAIFNKNNYEVKNTEKDTFKCSSGCDGLWNVGWYPSADHDGRRFCPNCTGAD